LRFGLVSEAGLLNHAIGQESHPMKAWHWTALGGAILLVAVGLGLAYRLWPRSGRPAEPVYEGRTLAGWVERLKDPDPRAGAEAADALVRAGPDAVPALLEARKDADIRLHRRAAAALVRLGREAAPGLVAALEGKNDRIETALVRMGAEAVPALADALKDTERAGEAARVLGLIGPRARDAVPSLVAVLQDEKGPPPARAEAAQALGRDEDREVRRAAARALRLIDPEAARTAGVPCRSGFPA
jgi:HEAT repeat protein